MSLSNTAKQLSQIQKSVLEHHAASLNISLSSLEKLISHNLGTLRSAVQASIDHADSLQDFQDANQVASLQANVIQPVLEKSAHYYRGLYDIVAEAQREFASLAEKQHAHFNESLSSGLDWVSKSTGHSDVAIAAVKTAVSAANTVFENAHKAARQVSEFTDASLNAATAATVRAVGAANAPSRKKVA